MQKISTLTWKGKLKSWSGESLLLRIARGIASGVWIALLAFVCSGGLLWLLMATRDEGMHRCMEANSYEVCNLYRE